MDTNPTLSPNEEQHPESTQADNPHLDDSLEDTALAKRTNPMLYAYGGHQTPTDELSGSTETSIPIKRGDTTEEIPAYLDTAARRKDIFDSETTERAFQTDITKLATASASNMQPAPPAKISRRQAKRDARRLTRYADIRRQQYELFNKLLDTLTRVDDLSDVYLKQMRDAIFHTDHPFLLTLVGPFSSGKSSVINALLGAKVLSVGPTPTTDHIAILRHGDSEQQSRSGEVSTIFYPADLLQRFSLVDTPGLESVFKRHDALTQSFLHRADIVILVMIATQVLSASDLAFMQNLKEYGKRLIIIVNQVDVLEPEDRIKVLEFVKEQSTLQLGLEPLVWLVSAKQAIEAQQTEVLNESLWQESGFAEVTTYLEETLDDVERIRQKLETPLQIARNATQAALKHIETSQLALDEHRKTVENIEAQIQAAQRERERILEKTIADLDVEWHKAADQGVQAIGDMFQPSRTVGQSLGGCLELVGVGRLMRRFGKQTQAQEAFTRYEVRAVLDNIPKIADKLGPSLEGRDQEDIDRLVDYTRQQLQRLPETLKNKVIGKIETPTHYERKPLRTIRGDLDDVVHKAGFFETSRIDRALRATVITMALWIFIVVVMGLLIATGNIFQGGGVINVVIILGLALLGLSLLPIRGWMLQRGYRTSVRELQSKYKSMLTRASHEQIEYGTQLRRDVTAPFTRLITTQIELAHQRKNELQAHEQAVINLQHGLSAMLKD